MLEQWTHSSCFFSECISYKSHVSAIKATKGEAVGVNFHPPAPPAPDSSSIETIALALAHAHASAATVTPAALHARAQRATSATIALTLAHAHAQADAPRSRVRTMRRYGVRPTFSQLVSLRSSRCFQGSELVSLR